MMKTRELVIKFFSGRVIKSSVASPSDKLSMTFDVSYQAKSDFPHGFVVSLSG